MKVIGFLTVSSIFNYGVGMFIMWDIGWITAIVDWDPEDRAILGFGLLMGSLVCLYFWELAKLIRKGGNYD